MTKRYANLRYFTCFPKSDKQHQTMNCIVWTSSSPKFEGGLQSLNDVDDNALETTVAIQHSRSKQEHSESADLRQKFLDPFADAGDF